MVGANVSEARLVDIESIEGVPPKFKIGKYALSVRRFDRAPGGGRIHAVDFAQMPAPSPIRSTFGGTRIPS
ncbi:hypothetical protein [Bradyrhizobium iriomotense]|uniref:hypothetical protein n=1 Tax=Bradyrhizobium iriomotense TaxID=441950 RepID=UPI003D67634B